ncbi:Protein of unknown function [Cotesia congregata]|uniref:Uncharacterized protein n=1 Tax=Cotesia congregata TaxID=51543 RepID=A0A8J2MSK6_COTCN|nr:Protein of unknown function [Cotesia congregata]
MSIPLRTLYRWEQNRISSKNCLENIKNNHSNTNTEENEAIQYERLHEDSPITVDECVFNLLNFYCKHNITKAALKESLELQLKLLPENNRMPKTLFKLFQYAQSIAPRCEVIKHYYCKKCLYTVDFEFSDKERYLFHSKGFDLTSIAIYSRAKINTIVYTSEIYKIIKTNNYTVLIKADDSIIYGTVRFFAEIEEDLWIVIHRLTVDHTKIFYHEQTRSKIEHIVPNINLITQLKRLRKYYKRVRERKDSRAQPTRNKERGKRDGEERRETSESSRGSILGSPVA